MPAFGPVEAALRTGKHGIQPGPPAVTWLATAGHKDARYANLPTVYTIHNLRHQGTASWQVFEFLGLITHALAEERFGEVNFMARGIFHATMVSTVSPTYAR